MLNRIIKDARLQQHLTLRQLAENLNHEFDLNLSAGMLSRYENGTTISAKNFIYITDSLNLDIKKIAQQFLENGD